MNLGMKGFIKLQTINRFSGKITSDTGFFPNTILDSGRNVMATEANWLTHCHVGTNNTPPTQSDTSLFGYFAGTADIQEITNGQQGFAPYYGWKHIRYRFPVGSVAANLSEAGIGWGISGSTLISRALILDPVLGTPVTVTPLADELLDVTYELRYYPPLSDVIGPQVILNGVTYDTITRAANIASASWSAYIGFTLGQRSVVSGDWYATDGNIGTILTGPSGVVANSDNANQYNSAYANNSYSVTMNCFTGATGWNLTNGIRSLLVHTNAGDYQTQFNAISTGNTIPKTIAYSMQMAWNLDWAEKI